jgi:hypothetical protein
MRFVKLTEDESGDPVIIRADLIDCVSTARKGMYQKESRTCVVGGRSVNLHYVRETPEQIMAMLEDNSSERKPYVREGTKRALEADKWNRFSPLIDRLVEALDHAADGLDSAADALGDMDCNEDLVQYLRTTARSSELVVSDIKAALSEAAGGGE